MGRKATMTTRPFRDDDAHLYALCASCEEGVLISEAFKEGGKLYHPDCAQVWRCGNCGEWNEKAVNVCKCGEKKEA